MGSNFQRMTCFLSGLKLRNRSGHERESLRKLETQNEACLKFLTRCFLFSTCRKLAKQPNVLYNQRLNPSGFGLLFRLVLQVRAFCFGGEVFFCVLLVC